jgi:phospholipase C
VYTTLTSNPTKWARTMLIVCYDEHGGFFDHVAPPAMAYGAPAGNQWLDPSPMTTLGVRIPAIVVSPLVEPGSAFHGLLDHTSILQLLVDRFGAPADLVGFGVAAQRKSNGVQSLASVLTRKAARADVPQMPAAPPRPGEVVAQAPVTNMGRMFQGVMAQKRGG